MSSDHATIEYRELQRADLPSFYGVIKQGLGELERSTGLDQLATAQFESLGRAGLWYMLTILRALGRAPIAIYVGAEGHRVLGTASEVLLPKAGYVLGVATDSAMRGRGIATSLLEKTHQQASRAGKHWMALDVEAENEGAIRIYKRLGYADVATFKWYVGKVPDGRPSGGAGLIRGGQLREAAEWVGSMLPPAVRDPLPPSGRMLSHLELIVKFPRAPVATWRSGSPGQTNAVVRATYAAMVKTGYVIPAACGPSAGESALTSSLDSAIAWVRSLGGTRVVVAVSQVSDEWNPIVESVGLREGVSTILMVRPC